MLTHYTKTSVGIFSILFSKHFDVWGADKENLFNNQEFLQRVIISFVLEIKGDILGRN